MQHSAAQFGNAAQLSSAAAAADFKCSLDANTNQKMMQKSY